MSGLHVYLWVHRYLPTDWQVIFTATYGSIQSVTWKAQRDLKLKGNVFALAETAFTLNTAYVGSIRKYLYVSVTPSVTLQRYGLNKALSFSETLDKHIKHYWKWLFTLKRCCALCQQVPTSQRVLKYLSYCAYNGHHFTPTQYRVFVSNRDFSCCESLIRFEILWEVHTGIYCVSNMVVLNVESTINVACGEGLFVP